MSVEIGVSDIKELKSAIHILTERIDDTERLNRIFRYVNNEYTHDIKPAGAGENLYLSIITAIYSLDMEDLELANRFTRKLIIKANRRK